MDREQFWSLIEETRPAKGSPDDHALALVESLALLEPEEIVSFETHFLSVMTELDRESVASVAGMVSPLLSDDGFEDFRGWAILGGKEVVEDLLSAPGQVGRHFRRETHPRCELALVAAMRAYERKTGHWEMPIDYHSLPRAIEELPLSDEESRDRFPDLWRRFVLNAEQ